MLTDAIEFKVLAIEPEARLGIKLKIAESSGGLYLINHLTTNHQLRAYLIYIRIFTAPFMGFLDAGRLACSIKPNVLNSYLLLGGVFVVYLNLTIVHINSPMLDVNGIGFGEPHMTIDATA